MEKEQEQHQYEKTEISLSEIFFLNPEDEKRLHPHALKRFTDWKAEIFNDVPQLEQLTIDEINRHLHIYLNDNEKARAANYRENILKWLGKCKEIGNGYSLYSPVYSRGIISSMTGLKWLVKTAYERKETKAREEARKCEKDRQREEASHHVFPLTLLKEARRYLNKDDIDKLYVAAGVAIDVYLKQGESYLDNYKTFEYRQWLREIEHRKEKEQIRLNAEVQQQVFRVKLDQELKKLGNQLSPKTKDPIERFKSYCTNKGEARYLGESFADILGTGDDRKTSWVQGFIPTAEKELVKLIPEELQDFILTKPTAAFFLLPSANYSHWGVHCLDIYFDAFAVVTITVSTQAGQKVFNGYKFSFLTNLQEPEIMGFYQITITPSEPHFWQSVPISIIQALFDGNLQPPGITILERTDDATIYEIRSFKEDICAIHRSFERYCRSLGSFEKMEELGIINRRTAEILELPQPSINRKESKSKKAKAFDLFSEGKRPSDPEVKALGIKPETAYRYYQDWKKEAKIGNNSI